MKKNLTQNYNKNEDLEVLHLHHHNLQLMIKKIK